MPAETHVQTGPIERPEVLQLVKDQLADILEVDPATINEGDSFAEDLHVDSLELIELVEAIEEEFERAQRGSESRTRTSKISRPCVMPSTTSSPGSEPIDVEPRDSLCAELGYAFIETGSLDLALRHRSWCAENGSVPSNERLEFLGDAVLGLVITDHLYHSSPGLSEGVLAQRRSELVSATALAGVARRDRPRRRPRPRQG